MVYLLLFELKNQNNLSQSPSNIKATSYSKSETIASPIGSARSVLFKTREGLGQEGQAHPRLDVPECFTDLGGCVPKRVRLAPPVGAWAGLVKLGRAFLDCSCFVLFVVFLLHGNSVPSDRFLGARRSEASGVFPRRVGGGRLPEPSPYVSDVTARYYLGAGARTHCSVHPLSTEGAWTFYPLQESSP